MALTNYPNGISSFGVPVLGGAGGIPFTGTYFFVDPVNGADGNSGTDPTLPLATLYAAHRKMTAGKNDVCVLIGNGATSGTARLSLALAQADAIAGGTTVSAGSLVWSKNACHLIGVAAPSMDTRARISNVTTETQTNFGAAAPLVSVTAQGCYFANFSVFEGFATGGANEIAWLDSGGRNSYNNVIIQGGGDTDAAALTTFRSLKITGSVGENVFRNCKIGLDTLARGNVASVEMEIAGGSPRNAFYDCKIVTYAKNAGASWLAIGGSGIDREVLFSNCTFFNPVLPATGANATQMTVGFVVDAAAGGVVLTQNCLYYGAATLSTGALVFSNIAAGAAKGGLGVVAS